MQEKNTNCQQWKKRVRSMQFIYSELILNNKFEIAKSIMYRDYLIVGANFLELLEYFITNKKKIINDISAYLDKTWNFERLNYVDQAILILGYIENKLWKNDKSIIIDQAVITAKNYSDNDNYKYINAILNKIIQ
ncbi:MAG: transcription antitermination protein NusB [Ureaplasma sp.]|nr:transcription antitermination protein NusB [Ureaplasma sp.]